MAYDAVLLDLYDTLVWSDWPTWRQLVADRASVTPEQLTHAYDSTRPTRNVGGYPSPEADLAAVLTAAGAEPDASMIGELAALERDGFGGTTRIYPDVLPVLRELRSRDIRTVLVSNCSYSTRPFVERLGLDDELDAVVLSFEARVAKPDPEIYRLALERAGGIEPNRAVFVDDQVRYCDGAAVLGIDTRLIVRPNEPAEGFGARTADHIVIEDLMPLL